MSWRVVWIKKHRARVDDDVVTPPDEGDDAAFQRRALAQSRLWFRPILPVPDGTLDAADRMLLARRGYGRKA